jgi:hypothetical protein
VPPDGVFPTEMPGDRPSTIPPLDDATAERLLDGRLPPEDTPRPYDQVARVLRAAAGPATSDELAGQAAALAAYRGAQAAPARPPGPRVGWGRARLVAVALAGTLAVGGLWMADGARTAPGLRSPTGGPANGGPGSGASGSRGPGSWTSGSGGSGLGGSGLGGSGSLDPARAATGPLGDGGSPVPAPARDPAGGAFKGGGAGHRAHPGHPKKPKPTKPEAPKAKAPKPEAGKPKPAKP